MKDFVKDSTWEAWGVTDFDSFEKITPTIHFRGSVSEEVIKKFEVIKKLIQHSYNEYRFIDVAKDEALLTFELALRRRYFELKGEMPKHKKYPEWDMSLAQLIDWGEVECLFERNESALKALRKLRNGTAHQKEYQFWGYIGFRIISAVAECINELYDDVNMRKERLAVEMEWEEKLKPWIDDGVVFEIDDKRLLVFLIRLINYNNHVEPHTYHFAFCPIFDLKVNVNGDQETGEYISWECSKIVTADDAIDFVNYDGKKVSIRRIENILDKNKFNEWNKSFNDDTNASVKYLILSELGELRMKLKSYSITGTV